MDHNDFEFDDDFVEPIFEFFKQMNLKMNEVDESIYEALNFPDEYYFPPLNVITDEKKLIKNSIIWEIIEERSR
jgi:hypothetical protein